MVVYQKLLDFGNLHKNSKSELAAKNTLAIFITSEAAISMNP